jgi:hypothetical protein
MALADALHGLLRLPGATYSCVVERDSGRVLAESGRGESGTGDGEGVVPYSVARWGTAVAAMFDATSGDELDDVMITGRRSYHLLRALGPSGSVLVYLRLDRTRSNLAVARRELAAVRWGTAVASPPAARQPDLPRDTDLPARDVARLRAVGASDAPRQSRTSNAPVRAVPAASAPTGAARMPAALPPTGTPARGVPAAARSDPARSTAAARSDPARSTAAARSDTARSTAAARSDAARSETARSDTARHDARPDTARSGAPRAGAARSGATRPAPADPAGSRSRVRAASAAGPASSRVTRARPDGDGSEGPDVKGKAPPADGADAADARPARPSEQPGRGPQIPLPRRSPGRRSPVPPGGSDTGSRRRSGSRASGAASASSDGSAVPDGYPVPAVLGQSWARDPGTLRRLIAGLRRLS